MPAYRCDKCNINYPPSERERMQLKCFRCSQPVEYYTNIEFHADWRARVESGKVTEPDPEKPRWGPHPDEDSCPTVYDSNTDTIHVLDRDLRALGYLPMAGDIVKLNGKYYELLGFSLRGRMWWIEPFYFEDTSHEIDVLPEATGFSSDDIKALDHEGKTIYWDPRKDPFRELMEGNGEA